MSKVLNFQEYSISESMQDYIDKYQIHTVRRMLANGMLTMDEKDYDSIPYYIRRYRWMKSYLEDATEDTNTGKYNNALTNLMLLKQYVEEMSEAIKIAIKEQDRESGSKKDQTD